MRRHLFGAVLVTLFLALPGSVFAAIIRVEAFIDGRSQLILHGGTAQWQHFEYDAPGDPDGANYATNINTVNWTPAWSGPTNGCGGCLSDVFNGVLPAMTDVAQTVTVNRIQARDGVSSVTIVEQPSASNDYDLVVEFNDNTSGGAAWYIIELNVPFTDAPAPTMGTWGLIALALLVGAGAVVRLRRRVAA